MNYKEVKELFEKFVSGKFGLTLSERVPVVNDAYPDTFSPSMDGNCLKALQSDSLLDINKFTQFATIQPVIRTADLRNIKKSNKKYLSCFSMSAFVEFSPSPETHNIISQSTINETFAFLVDHIGINQKQLRVDIFKGSPLSEILPGETGNNKYIEKDSASLRTWQQRGLNSDQVREISSADTFLVYPGMKPHFSGYRNEVFVGTETGEIEIATIEFLQYQSVMNDAGELTDIQFLKCYARARAFGIERILQVKNHYNSIYQCEHISPLLDSATKEFNNEKDAYLLTDVLRAIHIIITDGGTYDTLRGSENRARRTRLNDYLNIIYKLCNDGGKLRNYLALNADLQPWLPELKASVEAVLEEMEYYSKRRK